MSSISNVHAVSYAGYGRFASGKRVQSAADGAAELSVIKRQEAQSRGYSAGERNIGTAKDMLNIADGAMSGIGDYLQRMRELAVQASNTAVVSDSDRKNIQAEVDQIKQGISDIASNTSFNTKNLLDGSNKQLAIATDSNGHGMQADMPNAVLKELGIADFDVTKNFSLRDIDNALEKVSSGRSSMGAQSNAMDYAYNYLSGARLNTTQAQSRLEDLDFPEAISEQKKKEVLQGYAMFMQKLKMENETNHIRKFFM